MLSKSFRSENVLSFCNISWRNLLADVCKKIDKNNLGLQVISPFGFELLEDRKFLSKSLKRLYCYIGIPNQNESSCTLPGMISKIFAEQLMASIHTIGINPSDIAILVIQDQFILRREINFQCGQLDKLIDIQTRIISDNIVHDYANYIICTVDSICSKKEEPQHFFENKRHRCRTYQLYIMLENIFGYLLPPMSVPQEKMFSSLFKLIDNSIQMFYTPSELFINASDYEIHLLSSLITSRVQLMRQSIISAGNIKELIKLQCDAYHVEGKLELTIDKKIYETAVNKIKVAYMNCV